MILAMSVLAHPNRAKWHPYLKEKLGDIPFSIDNGCGLLENGKKAWAMYPPDAKFLCVFNDDAIIGNDFYNRATALLEKHGDKYAYSFYMGTRKGYKEIVDSAYKSNRGFVLSKKLFFGVAICLPTKVIPRMFTYMDRINDLPTNRNFDTRIHRYVRSIGLRVLYPIPSLVDHRGNDENDSLVYPRGGERKAQYFIGEGENSPVVRHDPDMVTAPAPAPGVIAPQLETNGDAKMVGSVVIFVDMWGGKHDALVTYVHKHSSTEIEDYVINIAYIPGRLPQMQHVSSVMHKKHQRDNGIYWQLKGGQL